MKKLLFILLVAFMMVGCECEHFHGDCNECSIVINDSVDYNHNWEPTYYLQIRKPDGYTYWLLVDTYTWMDHRKWDPWCY